MTNAFISQTEAEALVEPVSHALITQTQAEALVAPVSRARVTQALAAILWGSESHARISQAVAQVLYEYITPPIPRFAYIPLSNFLLPVLPGLQWDIIKTPQWKTSISPHISGREARATNYQFPLWSWEMHYSVLREYSSFTELQTLLGFYQQRSGAFDTFLYPDPSEPNVVSLGAIGTGDGVTNNFTLTKSYGGFVEPVGYADPATVHVYVNASEVFQPGTFSFITPNTIAFVSPPAVSAAITASYTWYYRVRFSDDAQNYNNFFYKFWELKKFTIQSVKT